jgi:hypothetical protein
VKSEHVSPEVVEKFRAPHLLGRDNRVAISLQVGEMWDQIEFVCRFLEDGVRAN